MASASTSTRAFANARLAVGSRAIGIGDNAIWAGVADATDIAGNPRIIPRRGVVDVGCYESPLPLASEWI